MYRPKMYYLIDNNNIHTQHKGGVLICPINLSEIKRIINHNKCNLECF